MYDDYVGVFCVVDFILGEIKWIYKEKFFMWVGVLVMKGGFIIIGMGDGYVKVFDEEIGEEFWKF